MDAVAPAVDKEVRKSPSIDVRERQDLWFWSRELGLSVEQLQHVVEATGACVDDVREFLRTDEPARAA